MKVYSVGGSVRDMILGVPVRDQDYVVVGATHEQMIADGYSQVGVDFPVYLHPITRDEYALARTERKSGSGYHGFETVADSSVGLVDDLCRRDFTMNAIALEYEDGTVGTTYIDPFDGITDIKNGIIRHVSEAFAEDPVRVLRAARFAARYRHRGFSIASETIDLMQRMVETGELDYLTSERVWKEVESAFTTQHPRVFFDVLRGCGALKVVLPEIDDLYSHDDYRYLINFPTNSGIAVALMTAWMPTIRSVEKLCSRLKVPTRARDLAEKVWRYNEQCYDWQTLTAAEIYDLLVRIGAMKSDTDLADQFFDVVAHISNVDNEHFDRQWWNNKRLVALSVKAADLPPKERTGPQIGEDLKQARIAAISKELDRC